MDIRELQTHALNVAKKYDELNLIERGETWHEEDYMAGLVTDVGDLNKAIMAKIGKRKLEDIDAKIEHELNDILWSVLVLAKFNNIDLAESFPDAMIALHKRLSEK